MTTDVQARNDKWLVLAVAAVAVSCTLAFWSILPARLKTNTSSDYVGHYEPTAEALLQGRGFVTEDGSLLVRYPPGYPLLLAGVFQLAQWIGVSRDFAMSFFALLCSGLTTAFIYLLSRSIWNPRAALIPTVVWMTYPLQLWLSKQPNSELPFFVFLYGAFLLFWRAVQRRQEAGYVYLLTGMLVGFSMLIRPIAIGLGVVLAGILWTLWHDATWRARLRVIGFLLLGNLLMVLPWEMYVYAKSGGVIPLSSAGVAGLRDGLTFAVREKDYRQGVAVPPDVAQLMSEIDAADDELESTGEVMNLLWSQFKQRPVAVVKLFLIKAARSWYGTDSQRYERYIGLVQIPYLVLLLVAATIALRRRGDPLKQLAIAVAVLVIYFWSLNLISTTLVRYMVPVMGLSFLLLPAIGLLTSWDALSHDSHQSRVKEQGS